MMMEASCLTDNQGLAGRASYTYSGKYVGEFNFGYNGSENFAKGKALWLFPFRSNWLDCIGRGIYATIA